MQDTPRRRLYLSTAVDSESNFLDRCGRRRWRNKERRHERRGNKRKRKGMPSHRKSLARRPKRITEFVFSWTITNVVPSSPFLVSSVAFCLSLFRFSSSCPPFSPGRLSLLFQFLSPERNAMATLRGTKFRRKFLRKSHCHLSRSLIRRTYRSSREVSPPALYGALSFARDTASVFIAAVVLNADQYHPANLIYLKHSQSDHRELLVELIDGGLIKRARKGKSE